MRIDPAAFSAHNTATTKTPRFVIEIAFDADNSVLWYFTSHADTAVVPGGLAVQNVIEGLTGTSQTLNPDTANATIGNISFNLVDRDGVVSSVLGDELVFGRSTRLQRVRVYAGFEGSAWDDYVLIQTQIIDQISWLNGVYTFKCLDVQREMRESIFELATTTLQSGVVASDTTVNVFTTSGFEMVEHGVSFSDAPLSTVGYIRIDDEVIRYSAKSATAFLGCVRGALNTRAADHPVDVNQSQDRRSKVEEVVYLEMPAVKLIYALLTGKLYGQGAAELPATWQLGIPDDFVRLANFTGIGLDFWNPADDEQGFIVRFLGLSKRKGKEFIERELLLLAGLYMPVYSDGALGLKRMASVLAGASYVKLLDQTSIVSHSELIHDFGSLHNVIQIDWNHEFIKNETTRTNILIDADSAVIFGRAESLKMTFLGLHGSRHGSFTLQRRFDAFRDRYTGPPWRLNVECLPSINVLEVGDVVRVRLGDVRDFVANGTLDRSFEVQNVSIDWVNGNVAARLFASSRPAREAPDSGGATVLTDAWYRSQGTDLASIATIVGTNPGHITSDITLIGTADMNAAGSIFYYEGDLVIDPGVTITIVNNVQLRVRGFLQNNGTVNGIGQGLPGAQALTVATSQTDHNNGAVGEIGVSESGGAIIAQAFAHLWSLPGTITQGRHATVPDYQLRWDGTTLLGLPSDLRGTSGGSGMPFTHSAHADGSEDYFPGAAGGASGAGLILVNRGLAQGVTAKIDLSGVAGSPANRIDPLGNNVFLFRPGSGAGGGPGGLLVVLDGAATTATDLTTEGFVANYGATPITGEVAETPTGWAPGGLGNTPGEFYSYYVGTGDGTTFPIPSLSGARGGSRVQYVPANGTADPDPSSTLLPMPTMVGLASGTDELLLLGDGTIVPRIKVTWSAVPDARVLGYEIQFKRTAESSWSNLAPILGQSATQAWIANVVDGVAYDVRVRAAGGVRLVSEWVEIENYIVVGKTQPPADVTVFSASQNGNVVVFRWAQVPDLDLAGYEIRYEQRINASWANGAIVTQVTRGTQITSGGVPPGDWTLMIKARDTSGNYSASARSVDLLVTNAFDVIAQAQQAPDWLGTRTNFFKHWTGVLIPESTKLANEHTNAQLFTEFVPYPEAVCSYEAPEFDIGFDDTARIWGSIDSALGPGVVTGITDPRLEVDFRSEAGSYDGFEPWSIGDRSGRYFKHRLVLNTAQGRAKIIGFLPTVDQFERTESRQVHVAAGGSMIEFDNDFHVEPTVVAVVIAGTAAFVTIQNITTQSFIANVYDIAGVSIGGTINFDATGV